MNFWLSLRRNGDLGLVARGWRLVAYGHEIGDFGMRRLLLLFSILIVSLVLVACGGGGDTAVSKSEPAKPEPSSPTATAVILDVNEYPLTQIGNSDKYQFLNAYANW